MNNTDQPPGLRPGRPSWAPFGPSLLAIVLFFVIVVVYQIYTSFLAEKAAAKTDVQNLALVIESKINTDLEGASRIVASLVKEIDPKAMRPENAQAYRPQMLGWLKLHGHHLPDSSLLWVFDAAGNALYSSLDSQPSVNIADRPYFRQLKAHPDGPPVFSDVMVGKATGQIALAVAQSVRDAEGRFLGIVSAAIDLATLQKQFASVDLGKNGLVALRRLDNGSVVVRQPGSLELSNLPAPDVPVRQAILAYGPNGVLEAPSPVDGIPRLYGYRRVGQFPFFIAVALSEEDYLASWQRNAAVTLGAALLFLLLLAVLFRRLAIAESRRAQSENLLAEAQTLAKTGSWQVEFGATEADDVWHVSEELRNIFGYSKEATITAQGVFEVMPPEDREAVARLWAAARQPGGPCQWQHRILVNGQIKWLQVSVKVAFDESGAPREARGTCQDITEQKANAAQIEALLAEQKTMLNSRIVGIVKLRERRFVWINAAFAEMFGYTEDEMTGQSTRMIHPGNEAYYRFADAAYPGITQGGVYRTEIQFVRKNGSLGWYEISGEQLSPASGESIWAFVDITEKRQFETALANSERRLHSIFSAMAEGLVFQGTDGRIIEANPAAETVLGLSRDELLARTSADPRWQTIHEDGTPYPGDTHPVMVTLRTGQAQRNQIMGVFHPDRGMRWISINSSPVPGNHPAILQGVVATFVDVTDLKKGEAALRAAQAEADRANQAKSRFLAAVSHDLRQPLAALKVYAGLLNNPQAISYSEVVSNTRKCIDSLSELLDDLLDLSKLEAGVVTPLLSDFTVTDLFGHLMTLHEPEAQAKGLRFRCVPSRLVGRTDLVLFRRVLGNLLSNAIRYTERGGVVIGCRRRQGKTWIEVWDTGVGIKAEDTAAIFEEFKQLGDGARNSGSGLGLAIVAKTAALLGLEISVRSRVGRGSVFGIELPLGQLEFIAPAAPPLATAHRPLRIALVEDNPMVRRALVDGLQGVGHQVLAADTKAALLAELAPPAPDIVVSDYRLTAGETGIDVIAALRMQYGAALPAILITGDTDPALLRRMTEGGIVVLHKPLDLETLQAYLEDLTYQVV